MTPSHGSSIWVAYAPKTFSGSSWAATELVPAVTVMASSAVAASAGRRLIIR